MTEQAATATIVVKRNRTFNAPVPVYLGRDEDGKEIRINIPTTFRLLPSDVIRDAQAADAATPFLERILVKAGVTMSDDDGNPLPNQVEAIMNDPAISSAMVHTYLQETSGKNSNGGK